MDSKHSSIEELQIELNQLKANQSALEQQLKHSQEAETKMRKQLGWRDELEHYLEERCAIAERDVARMKSSRGWQLLQSVYRLRDLLIPVGSSRRQVASSLIRLLRRTGSSRHAELSASEAQDAPRELQAPAAPAEAVKSGIRIDGQPAGPDTSGERKRQAGERSEAAPVSLKEPLRQFMRNKLNVFLRSRALLSMTEYERPLISIVIVVFNKAEYTYQCLETIRAHAELPFEVIVVNNASTDETDELLERTRNINIIRMSDNIGFLHGTNAGALQARGTHLLMLNNDTQIFPGTLTRMYETLAADPTYGAVGPRLISLEGTLQEAGSIIWSDGSCLGYGRGEFPFAPPYSYKKEVDYVSGACLLVPLQLFKQAGMLDDRYAPAYYEETDLCMSLRRAGYKIIYQPSAQVIHYEFGSLPSMEEAIVQQRINQNLFRDKWNQVLAEQHLGFSRDRLLEARSRGRAKRILYVEDRLPEPKLGNGYPRSFNILMRLVASGCSVTFFPVKEAARQEPLSSELQRQGVEVFYQENGETLDFATFYKERVGYYDLVWISRPHNMAQIGPIVKTLEPPQRILYDAEAIFAVRDILKRQLAGRAVSEGERRRLIQREMELMSGADWITTVSPAEQKKVQAYTQRPVQVIAHCSGVTPTPNTFEQRTDLLFVGGLLHPDSPNEDAMLYFVKEIFPLVRQRLGCKLWIVGSNRLKSIFALESEHIVVTGMVEELEPYYNRAKLFVVPTRYAAGTPHKLLECMEHGVPAVVTPLIAEQLELDERTLLVGGTPEQFAERIVTLYEDASLWNRLREESLCYIERNHSQRVFDASVDAAVAGALSKESAEAQPGDVTAGSGKNS